MLRRRTAGVLLVTAALACGCTTSPDAGGPLPDGTQLVSAAAASFDALYSVGFDFTVSGTIPGLNVREVKGQANRAGLASGQADVQDSADRFELTFLVSGPTLYLTGQRGNQSEEPVPAWYSPGELLDPSHGVSRLLKGATGLKTETSENVQGVWAYRVTGELPRAVVSSVVPGIQTDVDVKFWVTESLPRELVRVWMQVPPPQPNEGAVMLELALSDVNVPVIMPPSR